MTKWCRINDVVRGIRRALAAFLQNCKLFVKYLFFNEQTTKVAENCLFAGGICAIISKSAKCRRLRVCRTGNARVNTHRDEPEGCEAYCLAGCCEAYSVISGDQSANRATGLMRRRKKRKGHARQRVHEFRRRNP